MPATATDQLSAVFSALADPTRRAILAELAERDATVTELTAPVPDLDAGGVATPEGARARRAHLPVAVGQVAREPPRGRPAARCCRLDRAVPAVLGLVPRPPRCPPCRGAGRRTHGRDGRTTSAGAQPKDHAPNEHRNPAARHLACVRRAAGARLPSLHRSRPPGGVVGPDRQLTTARRDRVRRTPRRLSTVDGGLAQPNPAFACTSTSTSPTSPTANCSKASCTSAAGCRRASSRSRRDSGSSSTTRPTDGRDWRSASGSPNIWRAPARRVGVEAFTKLDATLINVQAVAANHREVETWQS